MKNCKCIRRTVSFSLILFLVSCGYRWADMLEDRTISIPYVVGDEDGRLTSELITAFSHSFATVVRKGGKYELRVSVLTQQRDTIGFRIDRQQIKGKSKKNIVADEERTTLTVEAALYEQGGKDPVFGPQQFTACVDYDFVDGDSYRDLTFVDSFGATQTVLAFSLGQLESTESAREAATRPLYSRIAKSIVDSISASW